MVHHCPCPVIQGCDQTSGIGDLRLKLIVPLLLTKGVLAHPAFTRIWESFDSFEVCGLIPLICMMPSLTFIEERGWENEAFSHSTFSYIFGLKGFTISTPHKMISKSTALLLAALSSFVQAAEHHVVVGPVDAPFVSTSTAIGGPPDPT